MGGLTECSFLHILDMHAGALGAEVTRQSIPNLAVKLYSGDNTVGGALWENSSAPAANYATITLKFVLSSLIIINNLNTYTHWWIQKKEKPKVAKFFDIINKHYKLLW